MKNRTVLLLNTAKTSDFRGKSKFTYLSLLTHTKNFYQQHFLIRLQELEIQKCERKTNSRRQTEADG